MQTASASQDGAVENPGPHDGLDRTHFYEAARGKRTLLSRAIYSKRTITDINWHEFLDFMFSCKTKVMYVPKMDKIDSLL